MAKLPPNSKPIDAREVDVEVCRALGVPRVPLLRFMESDSAALDADTLDVPGAASKRPLMACPRSLILAATKVFLRNVSKACAAGVGGVLANAKSKTGCGLTRNKGNVSPAATVKPCAWGEVVIGKFCSFVFFKDQQDYLGRKSLTFARSPLWLQARLHWFHLCNLRQTKKWS